MLAVGTYKTRGGDDVKIVAIEDGIAIGYRVRMGVNVGLTTWRADNGRFFIDCDAADHSNDIIDTKPRIKFERWATIYRDEQIGQIIGGLHETLHKAKIATRDSGSARENYIAIARVKIDCTEGENLD